MLKKTKKKLLIALIVLVCLISVLYWIHGLFYVTTDDAYVNANVVQISPRVTGQVQTLYVTNNEYVKAGQALFDLDPDTYVAALGEYKGLLALSQAKSDITHITIIRQYSLLKSHNVSKQDVDTAEANYQSALGQVDAAKAAVVAADLNLKYTKITAPTNGWVTNVAVRVGNTVTANQALFALISDNEFWIDANFEETQIDKIHVGADAEIQVDMYPSHPFKGKVESISGGSGNAFSLLPPENATGNWVKVTQRIPVRIHVVNPDPKFPLRIGSSSSVSIHITPWQTK